MTGSGDSASVYPLPLTVEDLHARGVTFARATRPLSIKLVSAGLDALAALHGQSWGDDRPRRLGVEPLLSEATEPIVRDFFAALPQRFAAPRGFAAPVALHDPDRLRAAYAAYQAEVHRSAVCVVHGDAHIGNAYVEPDGRVGFVDWQTAAARLRAARAGLREAVGEVHALADRRVPIDRPLQAKVCLATQEATDRAVEATSTAHRISGGASAYRGNRLLRAQRRPRRPPAPVVRPPTPPPTRRCARRHRPRLPAARRPTPRA